MQSRSLICPATKISLDVTLNLRYYRVTYGELTVTIDDLTLDTTQSIDIKADIGDVFRSVLHRLGDGFTNPQGESLQMMMEEWAGGRWFRDRGNGIGHLWGHVQVIKPPVLLELTGPLFMSYPALNHRSEARAAAGRNPCGVPSSRHRFHRSGASTGGYRLEVHVG